MHVARMARYMHRSTEGAVKTISVEEAAETFEQCVREVEAGEEYIITGDGQAVAWLVPVDVGFGPLDRAWLRERGWSGCSE
jgi:antitoxin (DNA-binding transcriptional repressor) of toxin-antitoxin stability system